VLAGWLHNDFELGLAAIIESAIFNILVIPGVSVLFRPGSLDAHRNIVFRETLFYLVSVMVVLVILSLSVIYTPDRVDVCGFLRITFRYRRFPRVAASRTDC